MEKALDDRSHRREVMITHTEYINRLNDFITKSNEAIGNEIALLQIKATLELNKRNSFH